MFDHHLYSRLNTELLLLALTIGPDGKKKKINNREGSHASLVGGKDLGQ